MRTHWATAALLAAVTAAGCSDSNGPAGSAAGPGPATSDQPHLALTVTPGESVVAPEPTAVYVITDGERTIELTKAEVVLGRIELRLAPDGVVARGDGGSHDHGSHDHGSNDHGSSDDSSSDDGSSDDDAEFRAGPFLLDVPLGRAVQAFVSVTVPEGTYDRVEFEIRRFAARDWDAAVVDAHADLVGSSIRIEGTFDDGDGAEPFVYASDLRLTRKIDLTDPLVVDETTGDTELTVQLGLDAWFLDGEGALIDPATANGCGENRRLVEANIRTSMDAFEVHHRH